MALSKRKVCFPAAYTHPEFMDRAALESSKPDPTRHSNMAEMTGALSQISNLAAYTTELLDGLFRIAQETQVRIESAASRTVHLQSSLESLELQPPASQLVSLSVSSSSVRKLEIKVPQLFTRITNDDSVLAQYYLCAPPPQLHRIDAVIGGEQAARQYSDPRFFFEQW